MKRLFLFSIFIVCVCIVQADDYPELIKPVTNLNNVHRKVNENTLFGLNNAISTQEIEVDINALLSSDIVSLTINGESFILNRINFIQNVVEDYIYCAYQSENVEVSISKLGDNIQGIINGSSFGSYVIETIGGNSYVLAELDADAIVEDEQYAEFNDNNTAYYSKSTNDISSISISNGIKYIRILVMYTPDAAALVSNMTNKVYKDINNSNTGFLNSDINVQFELAYVGKTIENEGSYTFKQLLDKFTSDGDGFADEVHTLRERYSADVCVLLVNNDEYCGKAWLNANKAHAFAVVEASGDCTKKYTFAHEIGHNAGCRHDTFVDPSIAPYKYAHGYVYHGTGTNGSSWRTMMAYNNACVGETYCQRINYWSNPDVDYNGIPTGDAVWSDNARVWENNASKIASFNNDPISISVTDTDNSAYMDYVCWHATKDIIVSDYVVESGQTVEIIASSSITILPGTIIKAGTKFRAAIGSYSSNAKYVYRAPKQSKFSELCDNIEISIETSESNLNVELLLQKDCENVSIQIYDMFGHLQKVILNTNLSSGKHMSDAYIGNLPHGVYLLVTQVDGKIGTNKFIKL